MISLESESDSSRSHEDMLQNQQYDGSRAHHTGFHIEVARKYGSDDQRVFEAFHAFFECLPLAHIVESLGNKRSMFVVHGGLFMEAGVTIAQLQRIRRRRGVPVECETVEDRLFTQMMWADPMPENGVRVNHERGDIPCAFGPDITRRFCQDNNITFVVRSHQAQMAGYSSMHDSKLMTVFSACHYTHCRVRGKVEQSMGAVIIFNHDLTKDV